MAPYLLQWEAMQEARHRGMKHYDFLGIAPEEKEGKCGGASVVRSHGIQEKIRGQRSSLSAGI